jgi:hypothetical protein
MARKSLPETCSAVEIVQKRLSFPRVHLERGERRDLVWGLKVLPEKVQAFILKDDWSDLEPVDLPLDAQLIVS